MNRLPRIGRAGALLAAAIPLLLASTCPGRSERADYVATVVGSTEIEIALWEKRNRLIMPFSARRLSKPQPPRGVALTMAGSLGSVLSVGESLDVDVVRFHPDRTIELVGHSSFGREFLPLSRIQAVGMGPGLASVAIGIAPDGQVRLFWWRSDLVPIPTDLGSMLIGRGVDAKLARLTGPGRFAVVILRDVMGRKNFDLYHGSYGGRPGEIPRLDSIHKAPTGQPDSGSFLVGLVPGGLVWVDSYVLRPLPDLFSIGFHRFEAPGGNPYSSRSGFSDRVRFSFFARPGVHTKYIRSGGFFYQPTYLGDGIFGASQSEMGSAEAYNVFHWKIWWNGTDRQRWDPLQDFASSASGRLLDVSRNERFVLVSQRNTYKVEQWEPVDDHPTTGPVVLLRVPGGSRPGSWLFGAIDQAPGFGGRQERDDRDPTERIPSAPFDGYSIGHVGDCFDRVVVPKPGEDEVVKVSKCRPGAQPRLCTAPGNRECLDANPADPDRGDCVVKLLTPCDGGRLYERCFTQQDDVRDRSCP